MNLSNKILLIAINTFYLFLASAETCLESWSVTLPGCDYDAIIAAVQEKLQGTSCSHDAKTEVKLALGVDTDPEAMETILEKYTSGYFLWEGISKKGNVFDKEVFDGGTYYNEEIESKDKHGIHQHRLAVDPGVRVRAIYEDVAQYYGIEFPDHLTNFEDCDLRAAMCCFVQDRQANDNNGNCATPYEENCVDANPADNTDICYHDMENSPTSSRTEKGFNIFAGEDDGDSHCHGFAWAENILDSTSRYKGNNLFYVTLYDHLVSRGYVGNIPGAPKCGCIEQMPVVTRADCTEIVPTKEQIEFSYFKGEFNVSLVDLEIKFNACQGANDNNNDLEAYYERLTNEGKMSEVELAELRQHLVGETYCPEAIESFLDEKGIEKTPACEDGDPDNCGCGEVKQADYRGTISVTNSGRQCQRWDSNEPHGHSRKRTNFPYANLVENYCRNPDGEDSAWCYTTDPDKRWESCDVPLCGVAAPSMAPTSNCAPLAGETCGCDDDAYAGYRGTVAKTISGRECQRWDSQAPHKHSYAKRFPDSGLDENYCRNPSGGEGAWCYTTDPNKRWEYCAVPLCGVDPPTSTPTSNCAPLAGENCGCAEDGYAGYRGNTAVTEGGYTCQRWDSQEPHSHSRTPQRYANSGLVENYCRNPDDEPRAWCYTTDPNKRWQFCDVPSCD